jgi:hypothetical protein
MDARATRRLVFSLSLTLGFVACGSPSIRSLPDTNAVRSTAGSLDSRQPVSEEMAGHHSARLSWSNGGHWYPIASRTPGHLCTQKDTDFDEFRYAEGIPHCRRNVTKAMRIKVSEPYGVSEGELEGYQVDHLIPLALGGSNASENLWPVPYEKARAKAKFEYQTYLALKDGEITQLQAITRIRCWVKDNFIF